MTKTNLLAITLLVALIFASASIASAWTPPLSTPPNDNVDAPVNVGNASQNKQGVLSLGGLGVFGSALITSTAGYNLPSSLQLGVNGKIGATAYCDKAGNNCVSTLGGGTSAQGSARAWVTFRNIGGTVSKIGDSYGVESVSSAGGTPNFLAWDTLIKLDGPLLASNYAVVASPAYVSGSGRYNGNVLDWVCIWSKVSEDTIGVHCAYPGYGAYGNSIVSVVVF